MSISGSYNIRGLFSIYRFLRKEKFDIVHTNNIKVHVLGILAAFLAGIKIRICSLHDDTRSGFKAKKRSKLNSTVYFRLLRLAYSLSTCLITISFATKKSNEWLTRRKKVNVIYNRYEILTDIGSDNIKLPENFADLPIIAYNGRIDEEKGLHILVEAIKFIKENYEKKAGILILGKSSNQKYFDYVNELICKYNLDEYFLFAGFVNNIHSWLSRSHLMVIPSLTEGIPYSILDAWNCKLSVVAANVGGIPEVVTDGINGLLFKAGDTFQLAAKILYLIENPHIRNQLGQRGYQTLIDRFSITQHISQMEELYFVLAQAHGRK